MLKESISGIYEITTDELNISTRHGDEVRSTCPLCRDHRGNPNDHSLAINIVKGTGFCHHCNAKFKLIDLEEKLKKDTYNENITPKQEMTEGIMPLDIECTDFLENRNIDPSVASNARVGSIVFNGIHYLAFPFIENGAVVNVQYKRADGVKKEFRFATGGKIIPWNIDCIMRGDGTSPLCITEGMMDALALMQSGYHNVVSVPNGAGSRMEVFDAYHQVIKNNFSHIVFAGDTDEVGKKLCTKVKEYFGDMEMSIVKWSWLEHNCKDANDMLLCGGTEAVAFCMKNAESDKCDAYEVVRYDDAGVLDLYENGLPEGKGIGLPAVDSIIKYLPGYMYVITGYPGAGKSSFVNFITMKLLKEYGWRTLFFSPEKIPNKNHIGELITVLTGKRCNKQTLKRSDYVLAMNFLSGNVVHMNPNMSNLNKLLRYSAQVIRKLGIKVVVIDPFFYLEINNLNGASETTRYSEMLRTIRLFAQEQNVVMLIVAHPRKPNNNAERPRLSEMMYEVAGSSAFYNSCDVGIILERPNEKNNILKLACGKSRFSYLGKVGETTIMYDIESGRYADCTALGQVTVSDYTNWTCKREFFRREDISDYECQKPF